MIKGELHTLPLNDLIQWLAHTNATGKLTIAQGQESVEIYYCEGQIAAASTSDLIPHNKVEKVYAMLDSVLTWSSGTITYCDCHLPAWVLSVNLRLSVDAILLAFQLDHGEKPADEITLDGLAEAGKNSKASFTQTDALRLEVVNYMLGNDFVVPTMPQLASRVLELTRRDDYSMRDLGKLVFTDQAITARIMRYANSILHGGEREVDSLALAIQRLGGDEVVSIIMAASLQARRSGRDIFAVERRALWVHSSTAAFIARALAIKVRLNPHLGFLCGLLMDFGMTVLYSHLQEVLGRRRTESASQAQTQVIAELVRDYHPRVGRVVAEKWQLPHQVIESIGNHHCLKEATSDTAYVAITALADFLTTYGLSLPRTALEVALAGFGPERLTAHPAARLIGLSVDGASDLLADLPQNIDKALGFVSV